jgi:hypothetical protein
LTAGIKANSDGSAAIQVGGVDAITLTSAGAATFVQPITLTTPIGFSSGGTGQTTRQAAMDALAGAVTAGQYLRGDGTDVVMSAIQAADVPTLNQNTTGNAATATTANALNTANSYTVTGLTVNGNISLGATSVERTVNWALSGGRNVYLFGRPSDNVLGLYDSTAGITRWTTDVSGNFTAAGNVTAFSDERYKTNWRSVTSNFVEKLAAVRSGVYDRTDEKIAQAGVSAQSLQTVLPETVLKDTNGRLSVAYGNAALVACVELAKEVVKLRAEVEALKKGS